MRRKRGRTTARRALISTSRLPCLSSAPILCPPLIFVSASPNGPRRDTQFTSDDRASLSRLRRAAVVCDTLHSTVRVRSVVGRPRAVSRRARPERIRDRPAAHVNAAWRHARVAVSHDSGRQDRRRRMLIVGAGLMGAAGVAFAFTNRMWLLVIAGTIGVISPSGQEVGPFLPIEQAALSQVVPSRVRTEAFAWYTLAGSLATAFGALAAGTWTHALQTSWAPVDSYRAVVVLYALLGVALALMFSAASPAVEAGASDRQVGDRSMFARFSGIDRSHRVVLKLSGLFAL